MYNLDVLKFVAMHEAITQESPLDAKHYVKTRYK